MNCQKCHRGMNVEYIEHNGIHVKEVYKCPFCGGEFRFLVEESKLEELYFMDENLVYDSTFTTFSFYDNSSDL